jgi:hypothetical protein
MSAPDPREVLAERLRALADRYHIFDPERTDLLAAADALSVDGGPPAEALRRLADAWDAREVAPDQFGHGVGYGLASAAGDLRALLRPVPTGGAEPERRCEVHSFKTWFNGHNVDCPKCSPSASSDGPAAPERLCVKCGVSEDDVLGGCPQGACVFPPVAAPATCDGSGWLEARLPYIGDLAPLARPQCPGCPACDGSGEEER